MGEYVIEEEKRLSKKSDFELMQLYVKQIMSNFPSMVIIKALNNVMKKRSIKPDGTVVNFNFTVGGIEYTLNAVSA